MDKIEINNAILPSAQSISPKTCGMAQKIKVKSGEASFHKPVIEPLTVDVNGLFKAPASVDGYSPVLVNVPQNSIISAEALPVVLEAAKWSGTNYTLTLTDMYRIGESGLQIDLPIDTPYKNMVAVCKAAITVAMATSSEYTISSTNTTSYKTSISISAREAPTEDVTITLRGLIELPYKIITFKDQTGANTLCTQKVYVNKDAVDPVKSGEIEMPAKDGYVYDGWATSANGASNANALKNISANKTVYAAFVNANVTNTVTYLNDDGSVIATESVKYGQNCTYSITPESALSEYFIFSRWNGTRTNIRAATSVTAVYVAPQTHEIEYTWDEISLMSENGTAAEHLMYGDYKELHVQGSFGAITVNKTFYAFVIGIDHNAEIEGNGVTFAIGEFYGNKFYPVAFTDAKYNSSSSGASLYLNSTATNAGGWKNTYCRYSILGSVHQRNAQDAQETTATAPVARTLMAALPSDLRDVMKPITKWSDNVGGKITGGVVPSDSITQTTDYLPLLSQYEVTGTAQTGRSAEEAKQRRYEYFILHGNKVGYSSSEYTTLSPYYSCNFYTRTPDASNAAWWCCVNTNGVAVNSCAANVSRGIFPIFKV